MLLEYGSEFNDQYLHIKDTAGNADAPITISAYGDADEGKPVIASNGVKGSQWEQDYRANVGNHKNKGTVSTTLLLKDVSYITVSNLEITNDDADVYDPIDTWKWTDTPDSDGTKLDRSASRMDRTGRGRHRRERATMSNVTLDNLYIHDVDGNIYNKHMANGGIYFMAHYPMENTSAETDVWLREHVSRFDHVTIRNSTVKDVDRWGIAVGYTAYLNYIDANYGDGSIDDALIAKYGSTNVRIENNYVKGAGGDAITLMYCDRPVIEHNVGDSVSKHINTQDYTQPGSYGGRVAAGIWPWRCKDPVFQYNEMYNNLNAEHGNGDGQAWDADYGDGTLYQYNYSYGNSFASLMICNWYAVNTTFRYNISQNDRQGVFDLPSNGPGNHIYNNTVYVDADSQVLTKRSNSQSLFENNIFINATNTKKTETWNRGSQNGGQTYDNNMYVNYANKPTSDANAIEADDVSAVLAGAGSAPTSALKSGAEHARTGEKAAFDGYRPVAGSKAINAGKVVSDLNDYAVENDFLGNAVKGRPDLGAVESDVVSVTMASSKYETGTETDSGTGDKTKVIHVTFTDKNPVTVKELLSNVSADKGVDKAGVPSRRRQVRQVRRRQVRRVRTEHARPPALPAPRLRPERQGRRDEARRLRTGPRWRHPALLRRRHGRDRRVHDPPAHHVGLGRGLRARRRRLRLEGAAPHVRRRRVDHHLRIRRLVAEHRVRPVLRCRRQRHPRRTLRRPQADARPADRQARRRPAHGHGVEGAGVRHRHAVAQDVRRQDR